MAKNKYTSEHLEFIRLNIKNTEKNLVKMFNNKFNISITIPKLGYIKSKLKIRSGLIGGRFKKGCQTWNKGKKWNDYMAKDKQVNSIQTCFQKGNIPHNHRNVGSERTTKDGFTEVKISEPNRWKLKHRLLWEKEKGKIPKGHKVIFIDGNRQNVVIENLSCIDPSVELTMNRNKLFNSEPEITKSGILIASVIVKTNEKLKHKSKF